jgi:hypothetical protein
MIVVVIIIIIGKSHESDSLVFSFLWISQQYLFYRARSSALHPTPNLEDQVFVYMSLSDRVA